MGNKECVFGPGTLSQGKRPAPRPETGACGPAGQTPTTGWSWLTSGRKFSSSGVTEGSLIPEASGPPSSLHANAGTNLCGRRESPPGLPVSRKFLLKWPCHVTGRAVNTEVAPACHWPLAPGRCACPRVTFSLLIISQPQTASQAAQRGLRRSRPPGPPLLPLGPLPLLLFWASLSLSLCLSQSHRAKPLGAEGPLTQAGGPSCPRTPAWTTLLISGVSTGLGLAEPVPSPAKNLHTHKKTLR